jgi:hypothetical protein
MRKNLKFLMFLAIASVAFVSCEKDEENGGGNGLVPGGVIAVTVENGADYNAKIDSVHAGLEWDFGNDNYGYDIFAKTKYNNGNFSITLPETVDAKYLRSIDEDLPSSVTVSDKTANGATFDSFDAIKDGRNVGYFVKTNVNINAEMSIEERLSLYANGIYSVVYMYVDKPVTVTGSYTDDDYFDDENIEVPVNINVSLQKGWIRSLRK